MMITKEADFSAESIINLNPGNGSVKQAKQSVLKQLKGTVL
jgi:hypothetical protein